MKKMREYLRPRLKDESGLSLVEVIVAVVVISIVSLSAGILTASGIATAATQERRQIAVTVASGAMEVANARSTAINSATSVSDLFTGRSQAKVDAAWQANLSKAGVSQTYETWDPTATAASTEGLKIVGSPVTQSGTPFTVTTLFGTCYQPTDGGDCSTLPSYPRGLFPGGPPLTPSGFTPLVRVIIIVSWTSGPNCSAGGGCSYVATSLIDIHPDLEWVSHG